MRTTTWRRTTATAALSLLTLATAGALPAAAADPPEVTAFWLVDAATDTPIVELDDHDTLRLPFLPAQLSIEAVASDGTDSVRMEIDHVQSALENWAPYSLRGDSQGDFVPAPELRTPGWVTISAQPYGGPDLTGDAGPEVDLHLYLHQPDFVVRSSADVGDHAPGDGWCTTGPPLQVVDELAAVVGHDGLLPWEAHRAEVEWKLAEAVGAAEDGTATARSDGLLGWLEVDEGSSRALRRGAAENNELVLAQVADRSAPRSRTIAWEDRAIEAPEEGGRRVATKSGEVLAADLPLAAYHDAWLHELVQVDLDLLTKVLPARTCTLRAAIEEANALPGRQSILVDAEVGPFHLVQGQLEITDGVDLVGHGGRAVVDAQGDSRVLWVDGDHLVNLRSLELADGDAGTLDRGGALKVTGDAYVQMSDSVLRDSRGNYGGGAYVSESTLVLTSSAVHDNIAGTPDDGITGGGVTQRGGGVFNRLGNVTIRESAVFDNLAVRGAGLSNFGGTMRVENTSVIDNEALAIGGGLENFDSNGETGVLHLSFATVAHNAAGTSNKPPADHRVGGGLYNGGTAFMASSILAENTDAHAAGDPLHAPDCHSPDQYGFMSYRHNVVGVLSATCDLGDYSWGTTAWIDHGTPGAPLDPHLTSPFTWDHRAYRMITSTSPALDAGASQTASLYPCPDTDSRGRPRPVGAGCDIGGVERQ